MANEKIIQAKAEQVEALRARIENSVAGVLVDYRGITVAEDTKLRKDLREAGVHYAVIKNNIMRRAVQAAGMEALAESMTGTTAFELIAYAPIHNYTGLTGLTDLIRQALKPLVHIRPTGRVYGQGIESEYQMHRVILEYEAQRRL